MSRKNSLIWEKLQGKDHISDTVTTLSLVTEGTELMSRNGWDVRHLHYTM